MGIEERHPVARMRDRRLMSVTGASAGRDIERACKSSRVPGRDGDSLGVPRCRPGRGAPFRDTAGNDASGNQGRGAARSLVLGADAGARLQPDAAQVLATRSGLGRAQGGRLPLRIRARGGRRAKTASRAREARVRWAILNDQQHSRLRSQRRTRHGPGVRSPASRLQDMRRATFCCTADRRGKSGTLAASGLAPPRLRHWGNDAPNSGRCESGSPGIVRPRCGSPLQDEHLQWPASRP